MGESARVEIATAEDIAGLSELRLRTGWHASSELLSALVRWENARVWLVHSGSLDSNASDSAAIIASTSAIAAGSVGVIGNVAVHPDYRRRGLARATTGVALSFLRGRRIRSVLLDATSDGQPLYTDLGFRPVARSWYLRVPLRGFDGWRLGQIAGQTEVRLYQSTDLALVRTLDRAAFGGDREVVLALMLESPNNWLAIARGPGSPEDDPSGYLIYGGLRDGQPSIHLGPLVARSDAAAAALLASVLREDAPWRAAISSELHPAVEIRASLPGVSNDILAFYQSAGLPLTRDDVLMQLDLEMSAPENVHEAPRTQLADELLPYPGDPAMVYSWLAPMSF